MAGAAMKAAASSVITSFMVFPSLNETRGRLTLPPGKCLKSDQDFQAVLLLDLLGTVLLKVGLGTQTEVGSLDLVLPDLLGPQVGLLPILLGSGGFVLGLGVLDLAQLVG